MRIPYNAMVSPSYQPPFLPYRELGNYKSAAKDDEIRLLCCARDDVGEQFKQNSPLFLPASANLEEAKSN
jgi:hypothetical protein